MKVLFCGTNFDSAFEYTKEELQIRNLQVNIVRCSTLEIVKEVLDTVILIPFMCTIDRNIIDSAPKLRMIMQFGVGLEGVDIEHSTKRGVWVCNIPSEGTGNGQSCAEHAIFLCLSLLRQVESMNSSIKCGRLGVPTGKTLFRARILIYGFGGIGKQLMKRLLAFEPRQIIIVHRTEESPRLREVFDISQLHSEIEILEICHEQFVLSPKENISSEIVFICCTQNKSTTQFINHSFLSKFSQRIYLVNIARGGLFHYDDVVSDLENQKDGKILGLATDVFPAEPISPQDPIVNHPRVIATPHVAGVTEISYHNMANLVADNISRIFYGEAPSGAVNQLSPK